MKKICIILFAVLAAALCACQPTPQDAIVIPKENTEQEIIKSAEQYKDIENIDFDYQVPEHVTQRYNIVENNMDMVIDADVFMPDIDRVPVAKIVSAPFSQEDADKMREYFMQGGKLVTPWVATKADYDKWIIRAKKGHKENGEYVFTEDDQQYVDMLMEQREIAPAEDVQDLITDYSINDGGLSGRIKVNGEITGNIRIKENAFTYSTGMSFTSASQKNYDEETGQFIERPQKEFDYTQQQAIDAAYNLLADLGIDNMKPVEIDKIYYFDDFSGRDEILCGGYNINFMREFGGMVPAKPVGCCIAFAENYDVMPPIDPETIMVAVNEYGEITRFSWANPIKITEILTEHVDILPFEDILARLENFSKQRFAFLAGRQVRNLMLNQVYEIRLCLNYLPIKNNPNEYMYAPCWVFVYKDWQEYSDEELKRIEEQGGYRMQWDEMSDMYFVFSAVDGAAVSVYSKQMYEEVIQHQPASTPNP